MHYIPHLSKDAKLVPALHPPLEPLKLRRNVPLRLMSSIMSQQLSTQVAKVLYRRFLELYDGKEPTVRQVLATQPSTLRAIGLSNAKVSYIQNVAAFFIEHRLTDRKLAGMENEEIILLLTQIKGVGRWTVEMLLMFTLGREDVFAVDDLGIQQAMVKLFKMRGKTIRDVKRRMLQLSKPWSPYRTYACMHLWKWKDGPQAAVSL